MVMIMMTMMMMKATVFKCQLVDLSLSGSRDGTSNLKQFILTHLLIINHVQNVIISEGRSTAASGNSESSDTTYQYSSLSRGRGNKTKHNTSLPQTPISVQLELHSIFSHLLAGGLEILATSTFSNPCISSYASLAPNFHGPSGETARTSVSTIFHCARPKA